MFFYSTQKAPARHFAVRGLAESVFILLVCSHTQTQQGGKGNHNDRDDRHVVACLRDGGRFGGLGGAGGLRRIDALDVGIAGKQLCLNVAAGVALIARGGRRPVVVAASGAGVIAVIVLRRGGRGRRCGRGGQSVRQ